MVGAGLLIGFRVRGRAAESEPAAAPAAFVPNAFVQIAPDGRITLQSQFVELGQGIHTCLAMCIAEELDAAWADLRVVSSPQGPAYAHPWFGFQMTGGSSSTLTGFQPWREAGALARALLVSAAALRWGLETATLRTRDSRVLAPDGRSASYGELAEEAARLPPPAGIAVKARSDFAILGRPHHRIDGPAKVTGTAVFGIDVDLPGLLTGIYLRPPVFGGRCRHFDTAAATALRGVRHVAAMADGVVVIADDFWTARRAADAVVVTWDDGPGRALSTAGQQAEFAGRLRNPGAVAVDTGGTEAAFAAADHRIEADFDFPYLAHASMEPVNATARIAPDGTVEVWAPTQVPDADRRSAARVAGVPVEQVTLHTTYAGGSFGRKAGEDFVPLAVEAARIAGAPVKLVWRREDDMRGGYYRPRTLVRSRLGVDAAGRPASWEIDLVSQSIIKRTVFAPFIYKDGLDHTQTDQFAGGLYGAPHLRAVWHEAADLVPVLAWRDPGPIVGSFVVETLIDEAAHLAGRDPLEHRLELLADNPRAVAVLHRLRAESGWGRPPAGRHQGLALSTGGTVVGEVAEISLESDGSPRVHRVTLVVHCGFAVNPDGVRAQMMSGVIYGLSAALGEQITFEQGRVQQSNFHDYPVLRFADAPVVDIHIIESDAPPSGVGEPSTPLIAPAVANALFAATGRRLRTLPLRLPAA
jgi:isoquinoline 1-oxidoreductase beta subunit